MVLSALHLSQNEIDSERFSTVLIKVELRVSISLESTVALPHIRVVVSPLSVSFSFCILTCRTGQ